MNLLVESKVYKTETEEGTKETFQAFQQIQQFLDDLAGKKKMHVRTTVDMGDIHNGPEEYDPKETTVTSLDIHKLFESFFRIGHFNYQITIKPEHQGFIIETMTTYHLSSAWLEQKVEVTFVK